MIREDTTAQLQQLLRNLDPDAWAPLIATAEERMLQPTRCMWVHYPRLRCWGQTGHVFQTAMLRLHQSLTEVQPDLPKRFVRLAATQIRRTLIDLARHHFGPERSAAHHAMDIASPEGGACDQVNKQDSHDDQPEMLEASAHFREAVDSLPADECEVFQMIWYGNLEQPAVAEMLDISISTFQRRWYRARLQLGQTLSGHRLEGQRGQTDEQ